MRLTEDAMIASPTAGIRLPDATILTIRPFAPLTQRQARLSPELQTLLPSTW